MMKVNTLTIMLSMTNTTSFLSSNLGAAGLFQLFQIPLPCFLQSLVGWSSQISIRTFIRLPCLVGIWLYDSCIFELILMLLSILIALMQKISKRLFCFGNGYSRKCDDYCVLKFQKIREGCCLWLWRVYFAPVSPHYEIVFHVYGVAWVYVAFRVPSWMRW